MDQLKNAMCFESQETNIKVHQKSIVTYGGDNSLFSTIQEHLLTGISSEETEWRRSFGRPIKLVKLDISVVPFSTPILSNDNKLSTNRPIFHTFWCECSDLDVYKSTVKDNIDSWLKTLQQYDINDWMIILVETYDLKKTNKLIPRTTVLDKIRNDFATKHADRCISVINPIKSESRHAESWCGLITRIRHYMLTAYDKLLLRFEEIIREQRERRNQPDWDYCQYFLLQEELAFLFEILGVYDEALVQYAELDALFTQFILNSDAGDTPPWLNTFRTPLNRWTGIILNKSHNINLRKLIVESRASLLDLRSYLFSRQCYMLLLLNRPWEIAQRCLPFIYNTLSEVRLLEIVNPHGSLECWAILCALEVLDVCQIQSFDPSNSQKLELWLLYTAGLWALASDKLGQLGMHCGLMLENNPTSEQLHMVVYLIAGMGDPSVKLRRSVTPIDKLKSALSSKQAFEKQYIEYAELAMGTYKYIGRIRSARYIGIKLAKFHSHLKEHQTAATFMSDALKTYVDENWEQLAAHIQVQLAHSYKKINDVDKYIKICSSIASTEKLPLNVRSIYFEEMLAYLKNASMPKIISTELENTFIINQIEVNVNDKINDYYVIAFHVFLKCLLPNNVEKARAIITVNDLQQDKKQDENTFSSKSKTKLSCGGSLKSLNTLISQLNSMTVHSYSDCKEDKVLSSTGIIGEKIEPSNNHLNQLEDKQNVSDSKKALIETVASNNFTLKPGLNEFKLSTRIKRPGIYQVTKLCLVIMDKFEYQSEIIYPHLYYEIKKIQPTISINSKNLIAGLMQDAEIIISSGSTRVLKNTIIKLWTSQGLKIAPADNSQNISDRIEIALPSCEPFQTKKIGIKLFGELPSQKDSSSIEYKLSVQSLWKTEEHKLHFRFPLISCLKLYTAESKKFLQIIITGQSENYLQLIDPEIITNSSIIIKNLNSVTCQKFIIGNGTKISYLWEIESQKNNEFLSSIKIVFRLKYFPVQNYEHNLNYNTCDDPLYIQKLTGMEKSIYAYQNSFDVSGFETIFTMTSKIETRGCSSEFCRAGSICNLCVTVKRIISTTSLNYSPQLMYEVLADKSLWAVCGRTAGIFTLEAFNKQSVIINVMPLTSGYLPLPIVRLSRYISAVEPKSDAYGNADGNGPKLEPFNLGQIYNASKSQQVYVLPAVMTECN